MKNIEDIVFDTFYYNGHYSDEYGIYIGGINGGVNKYSLLPSKEIFTEKILGVHGTIITGFKYEPRVIEVPVYCTDISRIKEISLWLSNGLPSDFFFVGDNVKIQAVLDSNSIDITNVGYMEGLLAGMVDLKFICHSPFYTPIFENDICFIFKKTAEQIINYQDSKFIIDDSLTDRDFVVIEYGQNTGRFYNDGNINVQPLLKINTNAKSNITMSINGQNTSINNVDGWIYIDMKYMTVYKNLTDLSSNQIFDYLGDFIELKQGWNAISVTSGDIHSVVIRPRTQYV